MMANEPSKVPSHQRSNNQAVSMTIQHLQAAFEATLAMETLQFSEWKSLSTARAAAALTTAQQPQWQTAKETSNRW